MLLVELSRRRQDRKCRGRLAGYMTAGRPCPLHNPRAISARCQILSSTGIELTRLVHRMAKFPAGANCREAK